jgi:NADH-quinone oxidoreductase subunit C
VTAEEIAGILKETFGEAITEVEVDSLHPQVTVAAERWPEVARFLRDDPHLAMNMLRCISAVDRHPEPFIDVVYDLVSMQVGKPSGGIPARDALWTESGAIAVKIRLPRDGGHVQSVTDVWPAAEWHERESFDLVGVSFDQHPDLRRILCPDDWAGNPLRKDYVFPTEYEGIPAATAPDASAEPAKA